MAKTVLKVGNASSDFAQKDQSGNYDLTAQFSKLLNEQDDVLIKSRLDFPTFAENVFPDTSGKSDTGYLKLADFHYEMVDAFQSPAKYVLILCPRGHGKSFQAAAFCAWTIGRNPNVRILIYSNKESQAIDMSNLIGDVMETERYIKVFGNILPDGKLKGWSNESKTVKRTRPAKEPTIRAAGRDSASALGGHFDIIIMDDVIDQKAAESPSDRKYITRWYRATVNGLLDQNSGKTIILGTRWNTHDFYGELIKMWEPLFETKEAVLIKKGTTPENNLWPEFWPTRELEIRRSFGSMEYKGQFENDPMDLENATLKKEWLHYIDPSNVSISNLDIWLGVDLSVRVRSKNKNHDTDYTVIAVVGQDRTNKQLYLIDLVREKADLKRKTIILEEMADKYSAHLRQIRIESNAAQYSVIEHFQEKLKDYAGYMYYSDSLKKKSLRILTKPKEGDQYISMVGLFESARIKLLGRQDEHGEWDPIKALRPFQEEWLVFSPTEDAHDDCLDAVQKAVEPFCLGEKPLSMMVSPATKSSRISKADTDTEDIEETENREKRSARVSIIIDSEPSSTSRRASPRLGILDRRRLS